MILFSSTASSSISETWITNHGTASNPAIYGNAIVWQGNCNGNWDVYIYDLSTKKQIHTKTSANQTNPAIYGNTVVYVYDINGGPDIYMYYLASKMETRLTSSGVLHNVFNPDVYGNRIVWADWVREKSSDPYYDPDAYYNIYVYDISTKKTTLIPTGGAAQNPSLYGDRIVWSEGFFGNPGIYLYDFSTRKKTRITNSNSADCAGIYTNKIVYDDYNENGQFDIHMYDLSTKRTTQITNNLSDQIKPSIYGNTVVWKDNRNYGYTYNLDIYAYDLTTHQQIHTTSKSPKDQPAINGDRVVWIDYRNGDNKPDVYMGTISFLPTAAFTASSTSGNHPLNVKFTDKSSDAYYWSWDFGDKTTSTLPGLTHKYSKAGKYTVTLTVKNAAGKNTTKKTNYITVK